MNADDNAPIVRNIPIASTAVEETNLDAKFVNDPTLLGRQRRGQVEVGADRMSCVNAGKACLAMVVGLA